MAKTENDNSPCHKESLLPRSTTALRPTAAALHPTTAVERPEKKCGDVVWFKDMVILPPPLPASPFLQNANWGFTFQYGDLAADLRTSSLWERLEAEEEEEEADKTIKNAAVGINGNLGWIATEIDSCVAGGGGGGGAGAPAQRPVTAGGQMHREVGQRGGQVSHDSWSSSHSHGYRLERDDLSGLDALTGKPRAGVTGKG